MSEIMRPLPFEQLMRWAIEEYKLEGRVFGVPKEKFYKNTSGHGMSIFGEAIDSPVGPAAGPNSQLSENIVAAFLAGSRFVELKTVQKMDGDELRACVARPCINCEDEGYNVEWSTELTVPQAFCEYVKAWIAIHVLTKEFGLGDAPHCVFNMSVGYDLDGIKSEKIDRYIEGMKDASGSSVFKDSIAWLRGNTGMFEHVTADDIDRIPSTISRSITLSTLHGCPPQEIERIAKYLLDEKKVHTFVKCNPTLLGYDRARELLDSMGYHYVSFDRHHFENDLQFDDAVQMLTRLMAYAKERSLAFGVKITNTFPVEIRKGELPGEEMYMSGRALFPLSITVASKLSSALGGALPISYSGGADAINIEEIFRLGIRPITVATTILKPGGYERLFQLAGLLERAAADAPAIDAAALDAYVRSLPGKVAYRKETRPVASRKTRDPLGLFDCFMAPCKDSGCPIGQQIPEYLRLVAEGKYDEALSVILIDNAAPSITGTLCNHACQGKCTRMDYEAPLSIRKAKWLAADAAQDAFIERLKAPALRTTRKVAVIGAGPAGVAQALYLRRNGVDVTVYEQRAKPFGIVEYVIPAFRIAGSAIERDFRMAEKMGVQFRFGAAAPSIAELKAEYDYVVIAIGAWKPCAPVMGEAGSQTLDALAFLEQSKANDCRVALGERVAVIGGGDVAMDCARAAMRAPGTTAVSLVYRRTRDFMPAEAEEISLALGDGVEICELLSPIAYDGKTLTCERMTLGDWDASGRRAVSGTGERVQLPFDAVINATGARVDTALFEANGIALDARGRVQLGDALETSVPGVYVAGDAKRGPSTVVSAMGDAKVITFDILAKLGLHGDFTRLGDALPIATLYARKGELVSPTDTPADCRRCLGCDELCELCCDVCPNRANVRIPLAGMLDHAQILHIDRLCNECGNCGIFCPHDGDPYRDKLTLFSSEEDFADSKNLGFLFVGDRQVKVRMEGGDISTIAIDDLPNNWRDVVKAVETNHAYLI